MKKEISISERPERFTEQYLEAFGNMSWYDFVTAMPSLVFVVTGWKSNRKENACLQSWSTFVEVELMILSVSWVKLEKTGICINH